MITLIKILWTALLSFLSLCYLRFYLRKKRGQGPQRKETVAVFAAAVTVFLLVSVAVFFGNAENVWNDLLSILGFYCVFSCALTDLFLREIGNDAVGFFFLCGIGRTVFDCVQAGGFSPCLSHVGGFLLTLCAMLLSSRLCRGGLGGGDVRLVAVLGLFFGFRALPELLMFSFFPAALCGLAVFLKRKNDRSVALPLAPFLCFGAAALTAAQILMNMGVTV